MYDITLISSLPFDKQIKQLFGISKDLNVKRLGIGINNNFAIEIVDRMLFSLLTLITIHREQPDYIYTRDIAFLSFICLIPKFNIPIIFECHKLIDRNKKFPTFLQDYALEASDIIFCISNGLKSDVKKKITNSEKVHLQRNCVDIDKFTNQKVRTKSDENKLITYVGSFKREKDVITLLKAFELLDKNFKLQLIGTANSKLKEKADKNPNIKLIPYLRENKVIDEMQKSEVLVYTSDISYHQQNHTSPMKLFEYMASKTVVIAADLNSTREIGGNLIHYYEPYNSIDLAEKISIATNEEETVKIKKAFKLIKEHHTWKNKSLKIYEILT